MGNSCQRQAGRQAASGNHVPRAVSSRGPVPGRPNRSCGLGAASSSPSSQRPCLCPGPRLFLKDLLATISPSFSFRGL